MQLTSTLATSDAATPLALATVHTWSCGCVRIVTP